MAYALSLKLAFVYSFTENLPDILFMIYHLTHKNLNTLRCVLAVNGHLTTK